MKIKIVVIAGPTASGKTALAVELAKRFSGEVVCADSMQIYKGMDIATAKPTASEMQGIPHHLVDFLDAGESFSVADYVGLAHKAVSEVHERGNLPIICGGTGLYISSLIENISFGEGESNESLREELKKLAQEKGGGHLLEMLREFDPHTAARLHENNLSRIIRAIEIYKTTGKTMSEQIAESKLSGSPYDVCMIGLDYKNREVLYERIGRRVECMLEIGLLEETERVLRDPCLKTSRQAIGYKELAPYFAGEADLQSCIECLKQSTRRYAKRQLTWFRRCAGMNWIYPDELGSADKAVEKAAEIIDKFLGKE